MDFDWQGYLHLSDQDPLQKDDINDPDCDTSKQVDFKQSAFSQSVYRDSDC